jgi:phasin family protein
MAIKKIGEATKANDSFPETVSTIKDGMSGAVAGFEKTQTDVKLKMEKAMKTAEEMVSFGQGNLEAAIKSSQIWATGMQDLTKSLAASAQAHMDQTMSTWKALSAVKSLKEAMDLQSSLARSSMESMVQESSKLTDASMKLAEQAIAPLTARVTLAVEKFSRGV